MTNSVFLKGISFRKRKTLWEMEKNYFVKQPHETEKDRLFFMVTLSQTSPGFYVSAVQVF